VVGTVRVGVPRQVVGLDAFATTAWDAARVAFGGDEYDVTSYLEAGSLLYGGALVAARWHAFGRYLSENGTDPTVAAIVRPGEHARAHDLVADLERLMRLRRRFEGIWDEVDVLAVPTVGIAPSLEAVAADPIGVNNELGRWTTGTNLLDLCAASVPCGWRGDGIPFGVTFLGPAFADAVVATAAARLLGEADPPPPPWAGWTTLVVVGAHLTNQPLNGQLTSRGGRLVRAVRTSPAYRAFALATDPPKPGLVRVASGGAHIGGELWALPTDGFGDFVRNVPAPMCIGKVELDDGTIHSGFLCEGWAVAGAEDITSFGAWTTYLDSR
jgi:allophanate hydrolase